MNRERDGFLAALKEDSKARETLESLYADCLEGYARVPGVEKEMGGYVQEISDDLYAQLFTALEDRQEWKARFCARMQEAQEKEHAAALALMVCLLYRPLGSQMQRMLEKEALPKDAEAVLARFADTSMEGAFACRQSAYPCLEDDQVRRLGLLLSVVFYGEWLRLCREARAAQGEDLGAMVECADVGAMAVWGFAAAELLCSKAGKDKEKRYARAVSMVALASLSMMLDFDGMPMLRGCITAMFERRRTLLDALGELCRSLGLEAQTEGHVVVSFANEAAYDEQEWLEAFDGNDEDDGAEMDAVWTRLDEEIGEETSENAGEAQDDERE